MISFPIGCALFLNSIVGILLKHVFIGKVKLYELCSISHLMDKQSSVHCPSFAFKSL